MPQQIPIPCVKISGTVLLPAQSWKKAPVGICFMLAYPCYFPSVTHGVGGKQELWVSFQAGRLWGGAAGCPAKAMPTGDLWQERAS